MDDLFSLAGVDAQNAAPAPDRNHFDAAGGESRKKEVPAEKTPAASNPSSVAGLERMRSFYGFVKYVLGIPVYDGKQQVPAVARRCMGSGSECHYEVVEDTDWQKRTLDLLDRNGARVSLRTANGSGKTSTIVSGSILAHMTLLPNSLVISTAGVNRQVRSQLWPELERHASKFSDWQFNRGSLTITAPNGSRYVGFTTDDAGKAEGWHGKDAEGLVEAGTIEAMVAAHKGPLYIIVDEAKSIPAAIFEAFDRCTYQRILYCSSPGASEGEFYKSQTHPAYPFTRVVVPARLCPHADHQKNAQTIAKRGKDHPLVRSSIFAEFASNGRDFVLSESDLAAITYSPPKFKPGTRAAFCDFAAGGDENVFANREGNRVKIEKAWVDKNTMSACAEFIRLFRRAGYTPETAHEIMGDADGLGGPMCDRLDQLGWRISRVRNGSKSSNAEDYYNKGTEIWLEAAEKIRRAEVIIEGLDQDDELRAQLLGRRQFVVAAGSKAGAMRIESKEDMRARGVASPDRADAVCGCLQDPPPMDPESYIERSTSRGLIEEAAEEYDDGRTTAYIPGAHC